MFSIKVLLSLYLDHHYQTTKEDFSSKFYSERLKAKSQKISYALIANENFNLYINSKHFFL